MGGACVSHAKSKLTPEAATLLGRAWTLLIVTWTIYGFVYLVPGIPGINQSADWVVVRQLGYTFADVVSKAIFGIMLAQVAILQSKADRGPTPAAAQTTVEGRAA